VKIAFVNLPNEKRVVRRFRCNIFTEAYLLPPIELINLASIKKNSVFIDAIAKNQSKKEFNKLIKKIKPDLLIFLSGFEGFEKEIEYVQLFRKMGIKVGCIGYLPSIFPNETIDKGIDFVISGEPEYIIMKNKSKEDFKGILKGKPLDLNEIPIINFKLMGKDYFDIFSPKPLATIETSRGCPFPCIYCIKPYGKKIRRKSSERVLRELKRIKELGYIYVRIMDDLFTSNKKWVIELCEKIIKNKLNLKFICLTRPDTIDEETVKKMKEAGFFRFLVGIESGSNKILSYYKRGYSKKILLKKLRILNKYKIETIGWFLVSKKDTKKTMRESLVFAEMLDWSVVSILEPRPGTKIFDNNKKEFSLFPYKTGLSKGKTIEKQKSLAKYFLFRYYFHPKRIIKIINLSKKYPKTIILLINRTLKYLLFSVSGKRPDIF